MADLQTRKTQDLKDEFYTTRIDTNNLKFFVGDFGNFLKENAPDDVPGSYVKFSADPYSQWASNLLKYDRHNGRLEKLGHAHYELVPTWMDDIRDSEPDPEPDPEPEPTPEPENDQREDLSLVETGAALVAAYNHIQDQLDIEHEVSKKLSEKLYEKAKKLDALNITVKDLEQNLENEQATTLSLRATIDGHTKATERGEDTIRGLKDERRELKNRIHGLEGLVEEKHNHLGKVNLQLTEANRKLKFWQGTKKPGIKSPSKGFPLETVAKFKKDGGGNTPPKPVLP